MNFLSKCGCPLARFDYLRISESWAILQKLFAVLQMAIGIHLWFCGVSNCQNTPAYPFMWLENLFWHNMLFVWHRISTCCSLYIYAHACAHTHILSSQMALQYLAMTQMTCALQYSFTCIHVILGFDFLILQHSMFGMIDPTGLCV